MFADDFVLVGSLLIWLFWLFLVHFGVRLTLIGFCDILLFLFRAALA